jgi:hypothetical protein
MAREVKVVAKGLRRKEPDLRKLARVLIELVLADDATASEDEAESL